MSNIKVNIISDLLETVFIDTTKLVVKDALGYVSGQTAPLGDDSTKIATTEFVQNAINNSGGGGSVSQIGGYPLVVTSVQENDVIQFRSGMWVNVPESDLTDGGNF